uniref:Uncharacterized protein n=1 Tax=Rhizophora mucronata TaxID=61149 RepID=A0A2P2IT03_RHIMU
MPFTCLNEFTFIICFCISKSLRG